MAISPGDRLPEASFMIMGPGGPTALTTADAFGGKTVALFSVPGAFTPTCTANHLPPYVQQADALKAKGVDVVACTAVNDPFVMTAWAQAAGADGKVEMWPDPDAAFAKALGLDFDASQFGLGVRGQRFSMLVKDGVAATVNIEPAGAGVTVSGVDTMLEQAGA